MTGKLRVLATFQILLLWFLGVEAVSSEETIAAFAEGPAGINITLTRFLCAVFLHIYLQDELN